METGAETVSAAAVGGALVVEPPASMRELRILAGLDYERLAALSNVSAPTVSRIEKGHCKRLRGETVEKLGLALLKALRAREMDQGMRLQDVELILIRGGKQ